MIPALPLPAAGRLRQTLRSEAGGLSVLMVFLIPTFVLIFAAALDLSKLNAQRRYVQAQADQSALSAVRRLPDSPVSRQIAANVVRRNPVYGEVTVDIGDVVFGNFRYGAGMVASSDQYAVAGVDAVAVTVNSPWNPILLGPFLGGEELYVSRRAIAARRDVAAFTLRNALLRLDTRRSILDAVLGETLQVNAAVFSYEGLALTNVSIRELADIVSVQSGLQLLTFKDVLETDITYAQMLNGLASEMLIPAAAITGTATGTFRLADLIFVAPDEAHLHYDRNLPDFGVSVFDLLVAMANLSGKNTHHRVNITSGLNAAPLANAALGIDLVDPGMTVFGLANGTDPLSAEVAQIRTTASGTVAGLAGLEVEFQSAVASAELVSLNCAAFQPADTVARFRVETHPATLSLETRLLTSINGSTPSDDEPISIAGHTHMVDIRMSEIGQPVKVPNPIMVAAVTQALSDSLSEVKTGLEDTPIVGGLLGGLLGAVTEQIDLLSDLIEDHPMLNQSAQALLSMLGIDVAQAEIVFHGYECRTALVQ